LAGVLLTAVFLSVPGRAAVQLLERSITEAQFLSLPELRGFYERRLAEVSDESARYRWELDVRAPVLFGLSWRDWYWLFEREAGRSSPGPPWLAAATDRSPPSLDQAIRMTLEIMQGPPYSSRIRARSTDPDLDR
jgi:hypothetical protein